MLSPKPVIVEASEEELVRWYGPIQISGQWVAKAIKRGSLVSGFGGLIEKEDGVWFAFFEVPKRDRKPSILRHIKAAFEDAKARGALVVRAVCAHEVDGAERLMRHLGFQPTEETFEDKVIWEWRF